MADKPRAKTYVYSNPRDTTEQVFMLIRSGGTQIKFRTVSAVISLLSEEPPFDKMKFTQKTSFQLTQKSINDIIKSILCVNIINDIKENLI